MSYLESLQVPAHEYYTSIAKIAFSTLKEDLELYQKLKMNVPEFFIDILKRLKRSPKFMFSSVLSAKPGEFENGTPKHEENKIKGFEDQDISTPKNEDAIDRLFKNEYIRKTSNIDDEDEPLENIIGSEKLNSTTKSSSKKAKKKKSTKKTTKTPKAKLQNQNINEESVTVDEETPQARTKVVNAYEEATPKPESEPVPYSQQEFSSQKEVRKLKESNLKLVKINVSSAESGLICTTKIQRHLILSPHVDQVEDAEGSFNEKPILKHLHKKTKYFGVTFEGEHLQNQMHILPISYNLSGTSMRIFDAYRPFTQKMRRAVAKFGKNENDLNLIIYEKQLSNDMIWHTFTEEGVWRHISYLARRSYKANSYLYFNNVNHWFATFRIMSDFFKSIHTNFNRRVQSIVYPTKSAFYRIENLYNTFSCVSITSVPLTTLLSKPGSEFTELIRQFITHEKQKSSPQKSRLLDEIDSF